MHRRLPLRTAAVVAVLLTFVAGGVAWAALPAGTGVVHGCVAKKNGALRVIKTAKKCPAGATKLDWNITGARGPAGAPGTPGEKGDKGDDGAQGPGALRLLLRSNVAGVAPARTVDGFSYTPSCAINNDGTVSTLLQLTPPSGVSARVFGTYSIQEGDAGTVTPFTFNYPGGSTYLQLHSQVNGLRRMYLHAWVAGSNGAMHTIDARYSADSLASLGAGDTRCMIEGSVTPAK